MEDALLGPADLAEDAASGPVEEIPRLSEVRTDADHAGAPEPGITIAVNPVGIQPVDDGLHLRRNRRVIKRRDEDDRICST